MKKQIVMTQDEYDSQRESITEEVTREVEQRYDVFPIGIYIFSSLNIPLALWSLSFGIENTLLYWVMFIDLLGVSILNMWIQYTAYKRIKKYFGRNK